jgi:hypothetical protein
MKYNVEIKWATILAVLLFFFQWASQEPNLSDQPGVMGTLLSVLGLVIPAGCLSASMIEKRKKVLDNQMTYLQAIAIGMTTTVMAIPIQALLNFLLVKYITPDYLDNAIQAGISAGQPEEVLRTALSVPGYIGQVILGSLFMGVLFSLLLAIILKRK